MCGWALKASLAALPARSTNRAKPAVVNSAPRSDSRRAQRGKIGLANWTPDGFIGQLLKLVGKYTPPPAGIKPPTLWGTAARLEELFQGHEINVSETAFTFRYKSPEHWLHVFRSYYCPTNRAFAALDPEKAAALEADVLDLLEKSNWSRDGSLTVPGAYLEVVITK
jgi:hypothetical protein